MFADKRARSGRGGSPTGALPSRQVKRTPGHPRAAVSRHPVIEKGSTTMYVKTVEHEALVGPPKTVTELCFQRCTWCTTAVLRTSLLCPVCASTDLEWVSSKGRGRIHGSVTVRRQGARPRTMAVVDLGDGVRLRGAVDGVAPGLAPYGAPVSVLEITPDGVPVFELEPPLRDDW